MSVESCCTCGDGWGGMESEKSFDNAWSLTLGGSLSICIALFFFSRSGFFPFVSDTASGAVQQVNAAYFAAVVGAWALMVLGVLAFRYAGLRLKSNRPRDAYEPSWPRFTPVEKEGARDPHISVTIFIAGVALLFLSTVASGFHYGVHSDLYDGDNNRVTCSRDEQKTFWGQRVCYYAEEWQAPVRMRQCNAETNSAPCLPIEYTPATDPAWMIPLLVSLVYWVRWAVLTTWKRKALDNRTPRTARRRRKAVPD